jgi:hypothetical protein
VEAQVWRGGTDCAAGAVDDWLLGHGEDPVNFDAEGDPVVRQSTDRDASIYKGVTWHKGRGKWIMMAQTLDMRGQDAKVHRPV